MYNFFKYQQTVKNETAHRRQQDLYSQWLLKNEDKKQEAKERERVKLDQWIQTQIDNGKTAHVEDDHYRQWRFLKQFRDVEQQPSFVGYKTFRHKPSHEMNKFFTERERIEMQHLALKKQHLVDSELIHEFQRGRSLRSQGPLHPKIEFRPKRENHEYLNPKMKFKNVTDKERLTERNMSLNQKFNSVYSSFEMKRSKIGVPKSSYFQGDLKQTRSRSTYDRYDLGTQRSFKLNPLSPSHPGPTTEPPTKIHFQPRTPYDNEQNLTESKHLYNSKVLTSRMPEHQIKEPRVKTYWKLAKTMELQEKDHKLKEFLVQSQYDRIKDLSNIRMNMTCENFQKRPVL